MSPDSTNLQGIPAKIIGKLELPLWQGFSLHQAVGECEVSLKHAGYLTPAGCIEQ